MSNFGIPEGIHWVICTDNAKSLTAIAATQVDCLCLKSQIAGFMNAQAAVMSDVTVQSH
jgi:hypothetical protein